MAIYAASFPNEVKYFSKKNLEARVGTTFKNRIQPFFDKHKDTQYADNYDFADTALGDVLRDPKGNFHYLNNRKVVRSAMETRDRRRWGAVVNVFLVNESDGIRQDPEELYAIASRELRYVEFNDEVIALGHDALLRDSVDDRGEFTPDAIASAEHRFSLAKSVTDEKGVDFFVSHNWHNGNAFYRWTVLCTVSTLFKEKYGRLPRFWLDRFCIRQADKGDVRLKTRLLPMTLMSCKMTMVLQSPYYLGCVQPAADPSCWCLTEFYTTVILAPKEKATENIIWVPLFEGRNVPPPLDLIHGKAYAFDPNDRIWLLKVLADLPGGLTRVQDDLNFAWHSLFKKEYEKWSDLGFYAAEGNEIVVRRLLEKGACCDLPPSHAGQAQPLALAFKGMYARNHSSSCCPWVGRRSAKRYQNIIKLLIESGANRLAMVDHEDFGPMSRIAKFKPGFFDFLQKHLKPEFASNGVLNLSRTRIDSNGAEIMLEFLRMNNGQLRSLCGVQSGTELLDLSHQDLRGPILQLLAPEKSITRLLLVDNPNLNGDLSILQSSPNEYTFMGGLVEVSFDGCRQLRGSLRPFRVCVFLESLNLRGVNLKEIEVELLATCSALKILNLSDTGVEGSIEKVCRDCSLLTEIDMSNTSVFGNLGDCLLLLSYAIYINVDNTRMNGSIATVPAPGGLHKLSIIECRYIVGSKKFAELNDFVHVSYDQLSLGSFLSSIQMKIIDLNALGVESISGSLACLKNCSEVETIDLAGMEVEGNIESITNCRTLSKLCLQNTKISGSLATLANYSVLKEVNLSGTRIQGSINDLCRVKTLKILDLSGCTNLTYGTVEQLPPSITHLEATGTAVGWRAELFKGYRFLKFIDLRDTNLYGSILCFASCLGLEVLKLGGNTHVTGNIEALCSSCQYLRILDVRDTSAIGSLTISLAKNTSLKRIDISACCGIIAIPREVSGIEIQCYQRELSSFLTTKLDEENGEEVICVVDELRHTTLDKLELHKKNKKGNLCCLSLYNAFLTDLNLSNCEQLKGELTSLTNARSLVSINLANTRISGTLDPLAALADTLKILDLSRTKVSGGLQALSACTKLTHLNVTKCPQITSLLDALQSLAKLQELRANHTDIHGTLFPLHYCKEIEIIDLGNCPIVGPLSPLFVCRKLKELTLWHTRNGCDLATFEKRLPDCTVELLKNPVNDYGKQLHESVRRKDVQKLSVLLIDARVSINVRNETFWTPVHMACANSDRLPPLESLIRTKDILPQKRSMQELLNRATSRENAQSPILNHTESMEEMRRADGNLPSETRSRLEVSSFGHSTRSLYGVCLV